MKAVVIDQIGAPATVRDVARPEPQPGEVLIKVQAASVNPFDEKVRMGALQGQVPHQFPLTLGFDLAGTVERLGASASRFQPDEPVFGEVFKSVLHDGSYAEYVTVPDAAPLARQPRTLGAVEAAALPMAGLTALALVEAIDPQPDQVVLIVGATGGLGGYATQLVAGAGARVIATAQADEADYVRGLGAAEVIDYRRQDVASAVRAAHPEGIDGLIDTVSDPAAFGALAALVRPGGRAASPIGSADVAGLAQRQVRAANAGNPASTEALNRLAELVDDGRLRVLAITRLPLEHAPQALERYRTGHVRGKIVLVTPQDQDHTNNTSEREAVSTDGKRS
jgi:NADPH:quinone reductase-like Zn-dependent oxidoreductase